MSYRLLYSTTVQPSTIPVNEEERPPAVGEKRQREDTQEPDVDDQNVRYRTLYAPSCLSLTDQRNANLRCSLFSILSEFSSRLPKQQMTDGASTSNGNGSHEYQEVPMGNPLEDSLYLGELQWVRRCYTNYSVLIFTLRHSGVPMRI